MPTEPAGCHSGLPRGACYKLDELLKRISLATKTANGLKAITVFAGVSAMARQLLRLLDALHVFSCAAATDCIVPKHEMTCNSIVAGLFAEALVPPGDVLDVGANDGSWACMYACFDKRRTVYGLEPSAALVNESIACGLANVRLRVGAVSDVLGSIFVPWGKGFQRQVHPNALPAASLTGNVNVTTIDTIFSGGRAGFLHLDIEEHELIALRGATRVMHTDRPFVQVEVMTTKAYEASMKALLGLLHRRNYRLFVVRESCGTRQGCRNLLCFPAEFVNCDAAVRSPTLALAVRSGVMAVMNASTPEQLINDLASVPVRAWASDHVRFPGPLSASF